MQRERDTDRGSLPQRQEKGLTPQTNVTAQLRDLGSHRWRYSPLTRTQYKQLTCDFATPYGTADSTPEQGR
jgi:hypothetical protein